MANEFKGLNRWQGLQAGAVAPATRQGAPGGTAGSQYRRQNESYGLALRLLRRQARRGDAGAAIDSIELRDKANAAGYTPGGIRRKDEYDGAAAGREQAWGEAAMDRERFKGVNRTMADEATGATVAPENRTGAALDIFEGEMGQDDAVGQRGLDSAARLGVKDPTAILRGDTRLKYRKTLDSALGKATDPAEVAALRERGSRFGISGDAFDKRAEWWNRNRK